MGRPKDPHVRELIEEILIHARVDLSRAIEPPLSIVEINGEMPSDSVVMTRFLTHAKRVTSLNEKTALIILWRREQTLRTFLEQIALLRRELRNVKVDETSRHLLMFDDLQTFSQFLSQISMKLPMYGEAHKGAIVDTLETGQWFLLSPSPTIATLEFGRLLAEFIRKDLPVMDRPTLTSPEDVFENRFAKPPSSSREPARRRPSSSHAFRAVTVPAPVPPSEGGPRRRS